MKTKKRLSVKQWAFIYSLIIIVSVILISTLLAFFITSNIKNKQLKRDYQEQYQHIQEIIEDKELNKDPDYRKSKKEDELLNEHPSEEVIFVKKV